jgi:hypothetical protein
VNLYFVGKNCDLKIGEFFRNVVFKALGVLAFMLVFTAIPALYLEEGFVRLAIVLMISTLTFVTSLLIFGLTKAEKNQFSVLIQSIKTKLF